MRSRLRLCKTRLFATPVAFHHFHESVPDQEAAPAWYMKTFGAARLERAMPRRACGKIQCGWRAVIRDLLRRQQHRRGIRHRCGPGWKCAGDWIYTLERLSRNRDSLQPKYAGGTVVFISPGAPPPFQGDVFLTGVNAAGTALVYSSFLGGSGAEAQMRLLSTREETFTLPEKPVPLISSVLASVAVR
jgi:hypothetical protein